MSVERIDDTEYRQQIKLTVQIMNNIEMLNQGQACEKRLLTSISTYPTFRSYHVKQTIRAALILAGTTCASQAIAGKSAYHCEIKSKMNQGFVASEMYIEINTDAAKAVLYDPYIHNQHGKPIEVDAVIMSKNKYRMKYELMVETTNSGKLPMTYTIRFDQGRQSYSVSGFLRGSDNRIGGNGKCTPRKLL